MCKKVLLIDDDDDEHLIFTEALLEAGIEADVFFAQDAFKGINLLKKMLFDFCFLDINMPLLNGIDCLELIKKDDTIKATPVIIYSTGVDDVISKLLMNKGALACVKKQNNIKRLASVLKRFLAAE